MQIRKTILSRLRATACRSGLAFGVVVLASSSSVAAKPDLAGAPQLSAFGGLPLYFEANRDQAGSAQTFVAHGRGCNFLIAPTEAVLTLAKFSAPPADSRAGRGDAGHARVTQTRTLRFEFFGANPCAQAGGVGELPGKVNYLIGNNPAQWRTGLPLFTQVRVEKIYPGVDLIYYGNQQRLEYDFVVAPKADPGAILLRVTGADKIRVDAQGDLVFSLGRDELRQPKPLIYQTVAGARKEISGGYRLADKRTVAFRIGDYDHRLPLVIDPVLSYSTFLGGTGSDIGWDIGVDTNGFIYVAGETLSANLAVTAGAFDTHYGGGSTDGGDAFVAKLDNQGTTLLYLTYLGGAGDDSALALVVDDAGDAYLTGFTSSTDFPFLNGVSNRLSGVPYPSTSIYPQDAFVTELGPSGSNLVFSTYLGGNDTDIGLGVAVDPNGFVYVTGVTYSTNFPAIGGLQTNAYHGGSDAFVTKLNPGGSAFVYSTYLGGTNIENGEGIVADAAGCAYVTGFTASTNFPNTNAVQRFLNNPGADATNHILGPSDAFITKLSPNGSEVVYSTFLGGLNSDLGLRLALDTETNVFVTGSVQSTNFPIFPPGNTNLPRGVSATNFLSDVFVSKLDLAGTHLIYSVMFGGIGLEEGWDVAVDAEGNAHVMGRTFSTNFPTVNTSGLLRATNSGGADVFVAVVNREGTALVRSAYLGGAGTDFGFGITVDAAGNDYIVGSTASTNFPTVAPIQPTIGGTNDAFIAKILVEQSLDVAFSGSDVALSWRAFAPEFVVQSNTNLLATDGWVDLAIQPVLANGRHTVTLGATNESLFFRLRR